MRAEEWKKSQAAAQASYAASQAQYKMEADLRAKEAQASYAASQAQYKMEAELRAKEISAASVKYSVDAEMKWKASTLYAPPPLAETHYTSYKYGALGGSYVAGAYVPPASTYYRYTAAGPYVGSALADVRMSGSPVRYSSPLGRLRAASPDPLGRLRLASPEARLRSNSPKK